MFKFLLRLLSTGGSMYHYTRTSNQRFTLCMLLHILKPYNVDMVNTNTSPYDDDT